MRESLPHSVTEDNQLRGTFLGGFRNQRILEKTVVIRLGTNGGRLEQSKPGRFCRLGPEKAAMVPHPIVNFCDIGEHRTLIVAKTPDWKPVVGIPSLNSSATSAKMTSDCLPTIQSQGCRGPHVPFRSHTSSF